MMPRFARSRHLSTVVPARVASASSPSRPEAEGTASPSIGAGTPETPETTGPEESGREIASPLSATAPILQTPHTGIGNYRSNGANGAGLTGDPLAPPGAGALSGGTRSAY